MAARARELAVPIIYVLDDDVGEIGSADWDAQPVVAPAPSDVRARKHACDAFHETELDAVLAEHGIGHLVIAGCKSEDCIDTTCRAAISRGFSVSVVADGHSTTDSPVLTAQQLIAHHSHVLNGFGAYCGQAVCEIVALPAARIAFDCAKGRAIEPRASPAVTRPQRME